MKVKELERFATNAWYPGACSQNILATVTAAEPSPQDLMDSSERITVPHLELFALNEQDASLEMSSIGLVDVNSRSTCLCWSYPSSTVEYGLLISGSSSGDLELHNPKPLLSDGSSPICLVTMKRDVHSGAVRCIDGNRFQTNLFASVAGESEVLIWDIEKLEEPMRPGNILHPPEVLDTVAWNPHVQHIMATASASHCTIWDLRRSDPVIHLTKAMCQFEPRLIAWSPDAAKRLCLADPSHPTGDLQLWDLRYPKHMLALLGRWPPPTHGFLGHAALGNAGTINALSWSPPNSVGQRFCDPDLVAVYITASGALPTSAGAYGTGLQPASADFLVVWSVQESLKAIQSDSATMSAHPQPAFIGRLEGGESESADSLGELPTNSSIHWLPRQPGLVSINQPEGWISVLNLEAGVDLGLQSKPSKRLLQRNNPTYSPRVRYTSEKVAEAFGEEIDLSLSVGNDLGQLTGVHTDCSLQNKNNILVPELPQPLPYLRFAPRWKKGLCRARFSFGGRLITLYHGSTPDDAPQQSKSRMDQPGTNAMHPHEESSSSTQVQLQWVATDDYQQTVTGLRTDIKDHSIHLATVISWMSVAIDKPVGTDTDDVCLRMTELCEPSTLTVGTVQLNPWELFRVRLTSSEEMPSNLSALLGYALDTVPSSTDEHLKITHAHLTNADTQSSSVSHLAMLKSALVTANHPAAIRLSLQGTFPSLSSSGLCPLNGFALLHAARVGDNAAYAEIQSFILTILDQAAANTPTPDQDLLKTISLLWTALLQDDWSLVVTNWPLEDWNTALAVLVNHVWAKNITIFQNLCAVLIERLLDLNMICALDQRERYIGAWCCSVLCNNVDGVIRAWYGMNQLSEDECRGEKLLILIIQILMMKKLSDPNVKMPYTPLCIHIFATVSWWIGQIWSGRNESDTILALKLVKDCNPDISNQRLNEMTHQLWCSLSDDARRLLHKSVAITCPYQSATATRCPCRHATQSIRHKPNIPYNPSSTPVPQVHSTMVPDPRYQQFTQPPPQHYMQSEQSLPIPGQYTTPPVPLFTPANPPATMQSNVPPITQVSSHVGASFVPHIPANAAHPLLPPSPHVSQLGPSVPPRFTYEQPTLPPTSTILPTPVDNLPPPPAAGISKLSASVVQPPTAPPPAASSRSWNDPPLLAPTYHPSPRPVVSVNQFYDPSQFSQSSIAPPTAPPSVPSHPFPTPQFPSSMNLFPPQPCNPSPVPLTLNASACRPVEGGEYPAISHMNHPSPLMNQHWPAAQPLGIHVDNCVSSNASNMVQCANNGFHSEAVPSSMVLQDVSPQYQLIESTLRRLIELCRTVGGKPFCAKMDMVERRLCSLFNALQGTPGSPCISDVILAYLGRVVDATNQSDYNSAVSHANQLIQSAPGFESIHDFAPALKVLLQSARHLSPNLASDTIMAGPVGS